MQDLERIFSYVNRIRNDERSLEAAKRGTYYTASLKSVFTETVAFEIFEGFSTQSFGGRLTLQAPLLTVYAW